MKEKCFADRKDGTCHALVEKECKDCKFYCPKRLVKNNPFYEYSYISPRVMRYLKKERRIREDQVMKIGE